MKTVIDTIKSIIADGAGCYTNDAGNGSGGPSYISADEMREMLDAGDLADYQWSDEADLPEALVADTLKAHDHAAEGTKWLVASKGNGYQSGYVHYLILWEV
jgi:hypothetical protein